MLDQTIPEGLHSMERTHAGALLEELHHMGMTQIGAGEKCEEEGVAERSSYGQTITPIPHPAAPVGGRGDRRVRNGGGKLSLGGREVQTEDIFSFVSIFHHPTLFSFGSKSK